ncbi:hypothetical protein RvY_05806 [Ramazzottius varieornatus]|uniref:Uncharacterized protein n=1 Tax=Ramazzottius varieornatus TaxID=947166 RepID=A0A1D1V5A9_RAMVA|nr:hypothetical protein RvY_05806 [Ramazzottius varieornatus]
MGPHLVIVHSGAGFCRDAAVPAIRSLCTDICSETLKKLSDGSNAMEAVCMAIALLEDSPLTNAGRGSNLTREGEVECDASVMDGTSGRFGACGAVSGIEHPVYLARAVFDYQQTHRQNALGLVPPMLLVGQGAWKFALKEGVDTVPPESLITPASQRRFERITARFTALEASSEVAVPSSDADQAVDHNLEDEENDSMALDTVGAIAVDTLGNVAVASSSGGLQFKHSGRVGQAAIYGAGIWSETDDGDTYACCTSGTGEQLIETDLARQLCRSLIQEGPFEIASTVQKNFLRGGSADVSSPRYMGALLLQVSDWQKTGRAFVQVLHTTPTFCWAYASSKQEKTKVGLLYRCSEIVIYA